MKSLQFKLIFYFFATLLILSTLILSYVSYNKYQVFKTKNTQVAYEKILTNVSTFLQKIDDEQIAALMYTNNKQDKDYNAYVFAQNNTNNALDKLTKILQEYNLYEKVKNTLVNTKENIKNIRSRVKTLMGEYENVFLYAYHEDVVMQVLDIFQTLEIKDTNMLRYIDALSQQANDITEKNFISFLLSREKSDIPKHLKVWEKILDTDLKLHFKNEMLSTSADRLISLHRESIVRNTYQPEYGVTPKEWVRDFDARLVHIQNTEHGMSPLL